jgi:shikimate dehydrogenase
MRSCCPYNQRVPKPFELPINASTRFCAVLGHPVRHSASPAMQNAGISVLGLNWRYLAFEVEPELLREALNGAKAFGMIGLNLTVPHKLLAMELVDELDACARRWGAVNTIRFEGLDDKGEWQPLRIFENGPPAKVRSHGFNTDADAITRSISEELNLELRGSTILLLGAGGAGRTAALKLAAEGVSHLFLVNRTFSKAEALAAEINMNFSTVDVTIGFPKSTVDLLLNATSLGLHPDDPLPVDNSQFRLGCAERVYDMIYRPAETRLLAAAKAAGCQCANGLGMLLYQGARALELWSGAAAPVDEMREALAANVYGPR